LTGTLWENEKKESGWLNKGRVCGRGREGKTHPTWAKTGSEGLKGKNDDRGKKKGQQNQVGEIESQ